MASVQQLVYIDKIPLDPGETTSADPRKSWLFADANLVKNVVNAKADDTLATATDSGLVPPKSATATHVLIAGAGANPEWAAVPIPSGVLRTANNLSEIATGGGQSMARTNLGLGSLATLSSVGTSQLDNSSVTYAKIQNVTTARMLGRVTAGNGVMEELTAAQVKSFLQIASTDITNFTSAVQALITSPNPATINHNSLLNYVANQHVDHSTVTITGTGAISGGGNLLASRTLTLDISLLPDYNVLSSTVPGNLDELLVQSSTNDIHYKVTKGNLLADYEQSESTYTTSSATGAAISINTATTKTVRRAITIPSALVTGGTLAYTVTIVSQNGASGSVFITNSGGAQITINVPSGYQVPSGVTVPTPIGAGKTREFFFVNNGTTIVWTVNEELITVS